MTGLTASEYESYKSGVRLQGHHDGSIVKLHLKILAVAFGCNYNRVATLQWGDGTDGTKYTVPSNASLQWTFHQLSHRIQSDSASGNNPTAEAAHHEIDTLRMQTLAAGLDAFKAHGLQDNAGRLDELDRRRSLALDARRAHDRVGQRRRIPQARYLRRLGRHGERQGSEHLIAAGSQGAATAAASIGSGTYDAIKA